MRKTINLRCAFTAEELEAKGRELAEAMLRYDDTEDKKREAVKEFTDAMKLIRFTIRQLSMAVREKGEVRPVECEVQLHVPEKGVKRTTRLDTNEIVAEGPMTPDELQEQLFPAEASVRVRRAPRAAEAAGGEVQ